MEPLSRLLCENALKGPVLLDIAKPSTRQVEMLASPALRLSHLAHLIGAQFVGPADPIIDGLARQDLAEEGDLVTFAEVTGQNDQTPGGSHRYNSLKYALSSELAGTISLPSLNPQSTAISGTNPEPDAVASELVTLSSVRAGF